MTVISDHKQIATGRRFFDVYVYIELVAHYCPDSAIYLHST